MQWKSHRLGCLFFLATFGLAGCGGLSETGETPPPKYGPVRVACPAVLGEKVIKPYARHWERETQGQVQILSYDPGIQEPPAHADVWLLPPHALAHWAAADQLRPLPEAITSGENYSWKSLLPLYRDRLTVWDRKRYGVPLLGESLLCCYRSDWLTEAKHRAVFEAKYQRRLEPPATWEQFADIAEYFFHLAQTETVPSLPPLSANADDSAREFFTIAANYADRAIAEGEVVADDRLLFSFQYDSVSGEPRLATGGFVQALRLMKRLQQYRPAGTAVNPVEAFAAGNAVICLASTAQLAALQKSAKVKDRFAICRMPGSGGYYDFEQPKQWLDRAGNRVPYLGSGGWLGVVPKSAADEKAAFSLLAYLSGPAVSKQIVLNPSVGGGPTRQEHLDSATPWDAFGFDPTQTAAVKDALRQLLEHPGCKNPALRLRTPDETAHHRVLEKQLLAALAGAKSPEQALQEAAERWQQMDLEKGLAAHRAAYRISMGLLPKE